MEDASYISSLCVTSLKGMRNISLHDLAPINLITGPNGSGKTTFLNAVELLANPKDVGQFLKFANGSSKTFYNLFDKQQIRPYIRIEGKVFNKPYFTELTSYESSSETTFRGCHHFGIPEEHTKQVELSLQDVSLKHPVNPAVKVKRIGKNAKISSLENIAKDSVVKEKVLSFLSLFDERYTDIYSPDFRNTYVIHDTYGAVDESFFSAGIQKLFCVADAMSGFHHGVLLLDHFESQLSVQTLYEGVSFLFSLAKKKQIQLFLTTHSQELIDEFLDILNFYNELDNLKVIRLKSDGKTSSFSDFSGKEAYQLRMEHELDFRYESSQKGETRERII